jgi:hypothetical protein
MLPALRVATSVLGILQHLSRPTVEINPKLPGSGTPAAKWSRRILRRLQVQIRPR